MGDEPTIQDVEAILSERQNANSSNVLVSQLLAQLDDAVVYSKGNNVDTNRKLWDNYSKEWTESIDWVERMADAVKMKGDLSVLGDEWAPRHHTQAIVEDFIIPNVDHACKVAEIGCGGGRITKEVAFAVSSLHCFDVSQEMLKRSEQAVVATATQQGNHCTVKTNKKLNFLAVEWLDETKQRRGHITFKLIDGMDINLKPNPVGDEVVSDGERDGEYDFIFAFDVFPHVDMHVLYRYLQEMYRMLKPGAQAFFSTSDITSEGGWKRFASQKHATVGGFCFTSRDIVLKLVEEASLEIVRTGNHTSYEENVYLNRDFLCLVRKPSPK
jgi:2-polyprenyl-3-methyl-5-hydroxy-6-metoxy-1,4-benzoquinol methylase